MKKAVIFIFLVFLSFVWNCKSEDIQNVKELRAKIGSMTPKQRCSLKPDPGPCRARIEAFYFDSKTKKCKSFFHGGCQGILPFETKGDCEKACR